MSAASQQSVRQRQSRTRVAPDDNSVTARVYLETRAKTLELLDDINEEDAQVQSMPDASPAKWHLAHTTWFFETFILGTLSGYEPVDAAYGYMFNSYYDVVGPRVQRANRGLLTRPSLRVLLDYRRIVDERIIALLEHCSDRELLSRIELGLEHEQQHQELLLMDLKHLFGHQPLLPAYRDPARDLALATDVGTRVNGDTSGAFTRYSGGVVRIGCDGPEFHFDNETPAHETLLAPYELANRLVTNGEYAEFIRAGGYERPELWLSDGYRWLQENEVRAPLYWHGVSNDGSARAPRVFTLHGLLDLDPDEPVCHVSYYEANAYARWNGARLPTEAEWENAASQCTVEGNFLESRRLRPAPSNGRGQLFGDVWEWTQSAYAPYPGYRAPAGALGEYNGKFMCNQMVLKGGSCITPRQHVRASYRNFFAPHCRWQFAGLRLARDA